MALLTLGAVLTTGALADGLQLAKFEARAVYATQTQGSSYTGEFAWTPSYLFSDSLGLCTNLALTLLKGVDGGKFPVIDGEILFSYSPNALFFHLGGGAQYWASDSSGSSSNYHAGAALFPAGTIAAGYSLKEPLVGFVRAVVLRYSLVFVPSNATSMIQLGVGF